MACCEGSNHNPSPHPSPGPSAISSPSPSPSPSLDPSSNQVCCERCQLWTHASCDHLSPKQLRLLDHAPYHCPDCRGELPGRGIGVDNQPPDRRSGLHPAVTQPVPAPAPPQPAPAPAPPPATPPEEETAPLPPPPQPQPQPQPQPPQPPAPFQAELAAPCPPSAADIPTVDLPTVDIPTVPSTIIWAGEMARDGNEIARDGGEIPQVAVAVATPATLLVTTPVPAACAPPSRSTSVALAGPSPEAAQLMGPSLMEVFAMAKPQAQAQP